MLVAGAGRARLPAPTVLAHAALALHLGLRGLRGRPGALGTGRAVAAGDANSPQRGRCVRAGRCGGGGRVGGCGRQLGSGGAPRWRSEDGRYRLSLEGRVPGLNALIQVSPGTFEAAELAARGFTDHSCAARCRRGSSSTMRRASSARDCRPNRPPGRGVRDRLSRMIQRAGVAVAEPLRVAPAHPVRADARSAGRATCRPVA
jgi:hypothetical protein